MGGKSAEVGLELGLIVPRDAVLKLDDSFQNEDGG